MLLNYRIIRKSCPTLNLKSLYRDTINQNKQILKPSLLPQNKSFNKYSSNSWHCSAHAISDEWRWRGDTIFLFVLHYCTNIRNAFQRIGYDAAHRLI